MSSEAEQAFKKFDFVNSSGWIEHFDGLFPTPSYDKLDKIKRKWFKKNIDSSLEVETNTSSTQEDTSATDRSNPSQENLHSTGTQNRSQQGSQASSGSNENPSQPQSGAAGIFGKIANIVGAPVTKIVNLVYSFVLPMKDRFYFIEGVLKFVFILSAVLAPHYANMIAFYVCLLGLLRQTGKPRWSVDYGKKALENEFLQNILYMIPFAFFPNQKTLVYFLPLGIHFWIGFCEFVNLKFPQYYPKIAKFADFTRKNRSNLMFQKAKLEIMLFIFLLILIFFGGSNLILIVFYVNFLKTKYMINPMTKAAFQEINAWVEGKVNTPYCPGIVKIIVDKVRSFCAYMVKM